MFIKRIITKLLLVAITLVGLFSFSFSRFSENGWDESTQEIPAPIEATNQAWVDSVLTSLTPEERIAQLFMVAAYSNKDQKHVDEITNLISYYKIGGLIFFQGGPEREAKLTNLYQSLTKTPLLISIDGEWGLAMRLDSTISYPRQMMLGAIQDNTLIYKMGRDIALQCKRIGIHVNLAPDIDVNNNPRNPVINNRSFGENKELVATKGVAYMKGMQDQNVLATAKHFPGHGDTDTDSHKSLPIINHSRKRLDDIELYPFRELIREGVGSVMVAHLYIPSLDSSRNIASTLSKPIVTGILKEELGYKGLIFTDALNMKGVSAFYKPGEVDVLALLAGNDVLLFAEDVPLAIQKIQEAIQAGKITQEEIDLRCKKILTVKQWAGLDKFKPIELKNIYQDLNTLEYKATLRKLVESSLTVLKNENDLLPLVRLDTLKIASIAIGAESENAFQQSMNRYAKIKHFFYSKAPVGNDLDTLISNLKDYNLVIVGIHNTNNSPKRNFGVTPETVLCLNKLNTTKKLVVDLFGNPYALEDFKGAETLNALVVSYEDTEVTNDISAQLIFGGVKGTGRLPVSCGKNFQIGAGYNTKDPIQFGYVLPEQINMKSSDFNQIDSIVTAGIKMQAYPGCQVIVAKEGKIFYNKSFGYHTYESKNKVKEDDIYDLASITKIGGTLPSLMSLQDIGIIDLDKTLYDYIPEIVDSTQYKTLILREMLAHQAGLVSWIPFFENTMSKGELRAEIYSTVQSEKYPTRVAENLYISKNYTDIIYKRIVKTPLKDKGTYKYSDLGYYFLMAIIEKITKASLNNYVDSRFYKPMGLYTMGYLPRNYYPLEKIIPTEYDMKFRRQLVQGDVHDPGAAMLGGVGGHAGLFSNANDLAKLMQMYLNWGEYGGRRYLREETVKEFAKCQYCEKQNRRGAGFDKPAAHGSPGPTCDCVSFESFGHTGFTGTIAWADPDENVVFIFLSNRVYPDAENKKLISMGIRSKAMEVIYSAIKKSRDKPIN